MTLDRPCLPAVVSDSNANDSVIVPTLPEIDSTSQTPAFDSESWAEKLRVAEVDAALKITEQHLTEWAGLPIEVIELQSDVKVLSDEKITATAFVWGVAVAVTIPRRQSLEVAARAIRNDSIDEGSHNRENASERIMTVANPSSPDNLLISSPDQLLDFICAEFQRRKAVAPGRGRPNRAELVID